MKETQLDYMKRKLEEYRAINKLSEIIVPMQRMFPGCQKYDPCCSNEKTKKFWNDLQKLTETTKPQKQRFRIETIKLGLGKPPEGFDGW